MPERLGFLGQKRGVQEGGGVQIQEGRLHTMPSSSYDLTKPSLPSLLSFGDRNSRKQQSSCGQVSQAVRPSGAGGQDPGRHP